MSKTKKIRVCNTRIVKEKNDNPSIMDDENSIAALFNGTIHFVAITFGNVLVPTSDINVALKHATLSAPIISKYCAQYGPNNISVDQSVIGFTVSSSTFSDADLQGWVNTIAKEHNIPSNDAFIILSPRGANNTDAPVSKGVLGYHGIANIAYCFVNVLGTGLTLNDFADLYAVALSHEIAEMCVDPTADLANPEVCDPCAGNCQVDYRNHFDIDGNYLPTPINYAFFTDGIVTPAEVNKCPASPKACIYSPYPNQPTPTPVPPSPSPMIPTWLKILIALGAIVGFILLLIFG